MNKIKKLATIGAAVAILAGSAFPAFAAKPAVQGCLGEDVSGYAQGGSAFGEFISGLATTIPGVGGDVQAHLAGDVPDEDIPNTCND